MRSNFDFTPLLRSSIGFENLNRLIDSVARAAEGDVSFPPYNIEKLGDDDILVRRTRHVVTENDRVLDAVAALEAENWNRFGELMNASHNSMRDDYEITVPTVDQAVTSALASGALGSRMTGGGFGGTVLALLPTVALEDFTARLQDDYAARGFDAPTVTTTTACPGGIELRDRA